MRLSTLTTALVLLSFWPGNASANPYLDDARALMEGLRFPEAAQLLEAALQVPSNEPGEKVTILELLARCQVARGDRDGAEKSFTELLSLAPNYALEPNLSPKIVDAFDAAKAQLFPRNHVALIRLPSLPRSPRVRLIDPWRQVQSVVLISRVNRQPWQTEEGVRAGDTWSFPAAAQDDREWFVEARTSSGTALSAIGTAEAPENTSKEPMALVKPSIPTPTPPAPPPVRRLLTWVIVGVGVLAAAAGTYLQFQAADSAARAGREQWVDTARGDHAQAEGHAAWGTVLLAWAGASAVTVAVLLFW